ncbi:phosphopantetheine-binding protein [Kitasatospora sp. NPDC049258]|uniref:phosphopantetheine-binding protein n=1 Tax=Kitasatospora sp. NPDC049258 TaxID=3155394 RepID=UPI0034168F3F
MTDTTTTGPLGLDPDSLRADLADILGERPEDIGDDDDLRDLGLDSIRLMSLVEIWRARGAKAEFADLADLGQAPTVRAWSAYLLGH